MMPAVQKKLLPPRLPARQKGVVNPLVEPFRWMLEELRTPAPVSVKRLQKMWVTLGCTREPKRFHPVSNSFNS